MPPAPPAPGWAPLPAPPLPPAGGPQGWEQPRPKAGDDRTGPLPLHPMTVADILDGSIKLLKANLKPILGIMVGFSVPVQLLAALGQRGLLGGNGIFDVVSDPSAVTASSGDGWSTVASLVSTGLNLLLLPFLAGAISQIVAASYLGRQIGAGQAIRVVRRRFWSLLGGWLLVHLAEFGAFVGALVLGAVLLAVGSSVGGALGAVPIIVGVAVLIASVGLALAVMGLSVLVAPAIVVEELGPLRGVRRSWALVRRRFWPVLGVALLAGLVTSVLGSAISTGPTVAALVVGMRWGWLLVAAGGIAAALITQPLVAIVATLQYFDARIRTEGFDLEIVAAELARAGAHDAPR